MRILFTTIAAPSHFLPLQPLALEARAAGHHVAFATGSSLIESIRNLGFTCFEAGLNLEDPEVIEVRRRGWPLPARDQCAHALEHVFAGVMADRTLTALPGALDQFRPDMIVSEATEFAGSLLAERNGIPAAKMHFGLFPAIEASETPLMRRVCALRERVGLGAECSDAERAFELTFAPRSYQLPDANIPANAGFFRPIQAAPEPGERLPLAIRRHSDRPIVYGSLGTVPTFNSRPGVLRTLIDALGACDVQGVVTCGRNQDPAALGPMPANVHVERYITQSLLLERCAAVICHGGYGTTMGALSFGVPLISTPLGADQALHADRCEALGVGKLISSNQLSADTLVSAIRCVLHEPSFNRAARELKTDIDALPGMSHAVQALVEIGARARYDSSSTGAPRH